jgi:putative two-component system response regulator
MSEKSTLLVIDDEPIARMTLKALLGNGDYVLAFAENGVEALEMAAQIKPDLILLDVMLPMMDGYEVCRRLRADPLLSEIPVMMISSLEDRESRLRGFDAGAEYFVTKPFDAIELQSQIRTVTQLNRYRHMQEQLEEAYDLTLEGFVRALGQRHRESEAHTRRLVMVTEKLARRMGIPESQIPQLRRGALIHDLGKIGIPDAVHLKEGPLTPEEWKTMREHPVKAREILGHIDYLKEPLEIALYHHERWDGTGYPENKEREEIPFSARIFAVVDVWEALSHERHYRARKCWTFEEVRAYISEQSGKHFDPDVAAAFLALLDEERDPSLESRNSVTPGEVSG